MSASNWIHLDVEKVVKETENALLILLEGEEIWIPKSQVSEPETYGEGDEEVTISVTEWIAKQKGLA